LVREGCVETNKRCSRDKGIGRGCSKIIQNKIWKGRRKEERQLQGKCNVLAFV